MFSLSYFHEPDLQHFVIPPHKVTRGPHTHFDGLNPPDPTRHFSLDLKSPHGSPLCQLQWHLHPPTQEMALTHQPSIPGSSQPLDGHPVLQTLGT